MNSQSNGTLYVALVAIVIAILSIGVSFTKTEGPAAAGGGTRFPNGISADGTSPNVGQVRGTTLTTTGAATSGGTLTVTTTDTATSTSAVGCIQTTATSTATPVKFRIGNLNTAASSTYASGSAGFVTWAYGNCP